MEGTYRGLRDENDPVGVSGICGLRPARAWFFFLPWPARCGLGGLVENGLAWAGNSGHQEPLQSLNGISFVDSCFFNRTDRDWLQWMQTGLHDRTGAVVALREKGKEEPPRDPRDAHRIGTPKSSPHGADDFSHHGPHDTSPWCTRSPRLIQGLSLPTPYPTSTSAHKKRGRPLSPPPQN